MELEILELPGLEPEAEEFGQIIFGLSLIQLCTVKNWHAVFDTYKTGTNPSPHEVAPSIPADRVEAYPGRPRLKYRRSACTVFRTSSAT